MRMTAGGGENIRCENFLVRTKIAFTHSIFNKPADAATTPRKPFVSAIAYIFEEEQRGLRLCSSKEKTCF